MKQSKVNNKSQNSNVSCNPLAQVAQFNKEGVDLAVTMGLCLGYDILFNKNIEADLTNIVVKDRMYSHSPTEQIRSLK